MGVGVWTWVITAAILGAFLAFDVFILGRRPHVPSTKECVLAISFYIGLAVIFGIMVGSIAGSRYAGEFFAGWVTEYSLSVDNLFIFLIIMSRFKVPKEYQQTALLIGIIIALLLRGIMIALGAGFIALFSWIFYIFGLILLITAIRMAKPHTESEDADAGDNPAIRWATRHMNATSDYNGVKLSVIENGKRLVTPMFFVVIAMSTADLLFAVDSIPAIFGLTREPYIVFTANVFALMGLRQLYFLLGGLLRRLVYLSYGLALILAFIGVKLILEALHTNTLPFINDGQPLKSVPEVPIGLSMGIIGGILLVTTVASLLAARRAEADEAA
ncbi:tellurite resistance protein TerC [Herbihabitans rhizosphaerae]|uniref:Tellurite resistance protein TerC n=1 Tax=Herbihabitans rhizosphaerae TaxID=1872711 RepID=A0A4Q7L8U5_9PSEU|nr:TerC/Alx family metal homeostasis membrane protein [Herbihabitans rhizosphaerae]RZS44832.1 tellurite resistance protein TerC [Herbihabitans rhizosphaerae]